MLTQESDRFMMGAQEFDDIVWPFTGDLARGCNHIPGITWQGLIDIEDNATCAV